LISLNVASTKLTAIPVLPKTCTTLNITGCTGIRSIQFDPTIIKTAQFSGSGITLPNLLLCPIASNYTF
jgi:hypothetical protein